MPFTLAIAAAIASLAATGAGVGMELSGVGQPSTPKASTPTLAQTATAANQTKENQLASLSQQTPNIQAATGGSLSPEAWAQMAEILSGQGGSTGISAATQDLMQKISTGNTNTTPGGGGLTNTTFA
jgi:hypothetical protein